MDEDGKQQVIKSYHHNASVDGDTRVENNKTTTHIIPIGQLNIKQDQNNDPAKVPNNNAAEDSNNDAAEVPNNNAAEDSNNNAAEVPNNNAAEGSNNDPAEVPNNNVAAEDPNNGAAEVLINDEEDDIIQEVGERNLFSSVPSTPVRRKRKVSSDHDGFQEKKFAKNSQKICLQKNRKSNFSRVTFSSEAKEPSIDKNDKTFSDASSNTEDRVGKHNSLRCELLRVQAETLYKENEYLQAASILEKLSLIQQEDVGVSALLLIAEVSIQQGKKQEAKNTIDDIVRLSMTSPSDVVDVFRRACDLIVDKSYVCAIVMLRISSKMFKLHPSLSPGRTVRGIYKCIKKIEDAVTPMIESGDKLKVIALDYALPYMVEMVADLRRVENSDPIRTSEIEAWCINWIGNNYNLADEYEKSIELSKSGLDVMERQFGNYASKYQIYGDLLKNLGVANHLLERDSIAKDYYLKAIDAYTNATDYSNEDEKRDTIESVRQFLEIARGSMK